jgi:hypothetical protein
MEMKLAPNESDLHTPLPPAGEKWHPQTIHTYYHGFQIPEQAIGAYIYLKFFPALGLLQGGVSIYRGLDNKTALDAVHLNYESAMPWPTISGSTIESENGLTLDFVEPGQRVHLRYRSPDGRAAFDLEQVGITPLFFRGHIMPGEETHQTALAGSGGSEQFMHCTGTVTLDENTYDIDCFPARDRSWQQVRVERKVSNMPPIGWSPICFGEHFALNQVGYESAETNPAFLDAFEIPRDKPAHHFGFVVDHGETRALTSVDRHVLAHDPDNFYPVRQRLEATDEDGTLHRFFGEAIALCPIPAWPNAQSGDTVTRWTRESDGSVAYNSYQELWFSDVRQLMRARQRAGEPVVANGATTAGATS